MTIPIQPGEETAQRWIEQMRVQILTEMAVLLSHLSDLEKYAQAHNAQIQREAKGLELIQLEISRSVYRVRNLVGQFVGSDKLQELLEQYGREIENDRPAT